MMTKRQPAIGDPVVVIKVRSFMEPVAFSEDAMLVPISPKVEQIIIPATIVGVFSEEGHICVAYADGKREAVRDGEWGYSEGGP
ncbi:hypothetical protein [uncultured Alsobacter sp.]|uniref:hypothetical protein n=1 Tax=uncultured Alsobacter sp. TaxID=1748258 RepID=UPI0025E75D2E|nr:hypothetical protein [uncultured Alsobacter sp.]